MKIRALQYFITAFSIVIVFLLNPVSYSAYWAKLNVKNLRDHHTFFVENLSEKPIRCNVRIGNDRASMEIAPKLTSGELRTYPEVRYDQISLYCHPIKKITHKAHWRNNQYKKQSDHTLHKIFKR